MLLLQINHLTPGPRRHSALTGVERPPDREHLYIKAAFTDGLNSLQGLIAKDNKRVPITLKQKAPQLPGSVAENWRCAIRIDHKTFKSEETQTLQMTLSKQTTLPPATGL